MKLTATTFLSLDGVLQAPGAPDEDRSGGFDLGGWLVPYHDETMDAYVTECFEQADAFLLGRRTHDIFAAFWPKVTDPADPVATKLNTLPKYVASRSGATSDWAGVSFLDGDLVTAVRELKARPGRELQVHGSGELLRTLLAHDLVDELRLWVHPVVLGRGQKLFPDGALPTAFTHAETRTTGTGVTISVLRPAGRPDFGAFSVVDGQESSSRP